MNNKQPITIVFLGAGRLSTATANAVSLAVSLYPTIKFRLGILSRDPNSAHWLAASCAARAAALGRHLDVFSDVIDWRDVDTIIRPLLRSQPDLIVQFSSLQSPWDLHGNDGWSRLVKAAGYGVTAPLQLPLILKTISAVKQAGIKAQIVNACFPDFTNQILSAVAAEVTCGMGNIAILSSFIASNADSDRVIRVLANHSHIADCIRGGSTTGRVPILFLGEEQQGSSDVLRLLPVLPRGPELNCVTGATAAPMLLALAARESQWSGHVPAPLGLPGGYPVKFNQGQVELDLPRSLSRRAAVSWNVETGRADGITVESDEICFVGSAKRALSDARCHVRYPLSSVQNMISEFASLKARLSS